MRQRVNIHSPSTYASNLHPSVQQLNAVIKEPACSITRTSEPRATSISLKNMLQ